MTSATDVTEAEAHAPAADGDAASDTGPAAVLGSAGHLAVGKLFIAASFVFLVVGRVADALVAAEGMDLNQSLLDDFQDRVFDFHRLADGYLFLIPAFLGLAIAVVPLQLGSSTIAFPRAAAASFWLYFLSASVLIAGYFVQDPAEPADVDGILLHHVGFGGVLVALLVATVCVVTTVLTLRTAGMGLDRVPMFAWGMVVAGTVWIASLPVLVGGIAYSYVDVTYRAGADARAYFDWAFGLPAILATALPLLGIVLDIVPVAAGSRLRNRGVFMGALGVAGVFTFSGDLLASTADPSIFQDALYVAGTFALLPPLLAILGGIGDTLRRGSPKVSAPLVLGVLSVLGLLLAAALNGVRVIDNLDLTAAPPIFPAPPAGTAVAELAIVAGILGAAAGLHHWATKLFGSQLRAGIGNLVGLVLVVGGLASAVPQFVNGFVDADETGTIEALNAVSTLGTAVVLLGVLLLILNVVAARDVDDAPDDPWGGHTLEWATASPPIPGGPGPIDPITSPEPLLDRKES